MKETFTIKDYQSIGINTDQPAPDLPPSAFTSGSNIDFRDGALKSSLGYEYLTDFPSPFIPLHLTKYETAGALYYLVFDKRTVYGFDGTSWSDLTGSQFSGEDDDDFITDTAGNILISTNGVDAPQYWDHPDAQGSFLSLPWDATDSWADKNNTCKSIKSFKGFYMALNVNEGVSKYPNRVLWSDPVPANNVPYWEYTLATSLSGYLDFDTTDGSIIDGAALNDTFLVFKDHSTYAMNFVQSTRVFNARLISSTVGVLGTNCTCRVNDNLIMLSDNDVFITNGSTFTSIISGKIRRLLFDNISDEYYGRSFVVHDPQNREVIFGIVTKEAEWPDLFVIYSYDNNTWAEKEYPIITSMCHSILNTQVTTGSPPEPLSRVIDYVIGTIPKSNLAIQSARESTDNRLVIFEIGEYLEDLIKTSEAERTDLPLGGDGRSFLVTRIIPRLNGSGSVNITLGSQEEANGEVTWNEPHLFEIGVDRFIQTRCSGNYLCYKIEADSPNSFELSAMVFEFRAGGLRRRSFR